MTPDVQRLVGAIPEDALRAAVVDQRWFGAKSREIAHVRVWDAPAARTIEPFLALGLVEVRFPEGTHETYHLPIGLRPRAEAWQEGVIAEVDGYTAYDALTDPQLCREVVHRIRAQQPMTFENGTVEFRLLEGAPADIELGAFRSMGAEQSNTSIVFDEAIVLKVYRRLEAGVNPELELLRFLTTRGFDGPPRAPGLGRLQRPPARGDAGDPAGVRPERGRRLGHRARAAGAGPRRLRRARPAARRADRADAHAALAGSERPGLRARSSRARRGSRC